MAALDGGRLGQDAPQLGDPKWCNDLTVLPAAVPAGYVAGAYFTAPVSDLDYARAIYAGFLKPPLTQTEAEAELAGLLKVQAELRAENAVLRALLASMSPPTVSHETPATFPANALKHSR